MNTYFTLLKHGKYNNLEAGRKGSGSGDTIHHSEKNTFKKIVQLLTTTKVTMLTTDSCFREKFEFLFKKADDYSVMILHPKLLNQHTLSLIDELITHNKVRFLGLPDYGQLA